MTPKVFYCRGLRHSDPAAAPPDHSASAISYRAIDPERNITVLDLLVVLDEKRIGDEAGDIEADRNPHRCEHGHRASRALK